MKKYYASLDSLSAFLDRLKNTFANKQHTHVKSEITDFDVQDIVDEVIAQLPTAEGSEF